MKIESYLFEEWRKVKGYEGIYEVSSFGRVRSVDRLIPNAHKNGFKKVKGCFLKQKDNKGYLRVFFSKDGKIKPFFVHRLVAWAFPEICGEWFEGACCNHLDHNKKNNRADNIVVCTYSENVNYADANQRRSEKNTNGFLAKKVSQYTLEGEFIKEWPSLREVKRALNIDASTIIKVCNKRKWSKSAGGFVWRYS